MTMAKNTHVERYAEVAWTAEDVKSIRPKWSLKKCEEALSGIEGELTDRMTELGFETMDVLLDLNEKEKA
jgi:hypothetical protein